MLLEPVKAKGTLIDKVGIHEDDKYIVAVTDKNTVVIPFCGTILTVYGFVSESPLQVYIF